MIFFPVYICRELRQKTSISATSGDLQDDSFPVIPGIYLLQFYCIADVKTSSKTSLVFTGLDKNVIVL